MCRATTCVGIGVGALCLLASATAGEPNGDRAAPAEAWEAGWPAYRGPCGDYAALETGVAIHADPAKVRLLWKSEAQDMPRGKAWSARDRVYGGAGHPGGGGSSPIVAFGIVYQFYTRPGGDVWYFVPRGARYPRELFRVEADDVVHAVDLATGRTRWVRTFARRSVNGQSMKSCIPDNHTPCVVGDTLVCLDPTWRLYGLDAQSGEWRWERPLSGRARDRELIKARSLLTRTRTIGGHKLGLAYLQPVGDDLVLVNDQSGGIYAVSAADGATRWRLGGGKGEPKISNWHQPAVWTHDGKRRLLLSTSEGMLCLDPANGKEQWRIASVIPHGHLVVVGDRLIALGGVKALNPEGNPMGHRGGVFGHPVCWELADAGAREAWRRDDLTTDAAKWAFRLDERRVAVLDWSIEGAGRGRKIRGVALRVLDLASGKDLAKPVSAPVKGTRNGYGIAAEGTVILEADMSHAHHDFLGVRPLAKGAAFSASWTPPHATTTAYDSYMMKPMIAGRRVIRGAYGLFCYDWRAEPADDGLFVAPPLPEWAEALPERARALAHPFQTERQRAAAEMRWKDAGPDVVGQFLAKANRPTLASLATAIARWGTAARELTGPLSPRIARLVDLGRGDSAAALAGALRAVDADAAKTLATKLASRLRAADPTRARAACVAIERLGPGLGDTVVAALGTSMERKDVAAQYAARALGRATKGDPKAVAILVKAMASKDVLLAFSCSQALGGLLNRRSGDPELAERVAALLPPASAELPTMARLGAARVAEQMGPRGRDYLIALCEAARDKTEAYLAALAFGFEGDETAAAYLVKTAAGADGKAKRSIANLLERVKKGDGGDLAALRVPEGKRY